MDCPVDNWLELRHCIPWWIYTLVALYFVVSAIMMVAKIRVDRRVDKLKLRLSACVLLESDDEAYELYRLVRELAKYECEHNPNEGGCPKTGRAILDWCPPCQAVHVQAMLEMRRQAVWKK